MATGQKEAMELVGVPSPDAENAAAKRKPAVDTMGAGSIQQMMQYRLMGHSAQQGAAQAARDESRRPKYMETVTKTRTREVDGPDF